MRDLSSKKLELAKKQAAKFSDGGKRKWLTTSVDSYGDESQRATLHVMEGSPPRAYIVECKYRGIAVLFSGEGDLIGHAEDYATDDLEFKVRWVKS